MMEPLAENEFYALFDKQGKLRTPMLHKSKRQIRKVWALLPDAPFVRARIVTISEGHEVPLNDTRD